MRLKIISVGRVKQKFVLAGEAEYLKRLKTGNTIELVEINDEKYSSLPLEVRKEKEGEEVFRLIEERDFFVALDSAGDSFTSEKFAKKISTLQNQSISRFTFALGGAHGWSPNILKKANMKLSLSPLTFPHQLARLILIEQIYRALSIIKGEPYHK